MGDGRLTNAGALRHERAEKKAGGEELSPRGHAARLVPAAPAMAREELSTAWAGEGQDVFGVRRRRGGGTENRRVERTPHGGQGGQHDYARAELEPPRRDVPVRYGVAQHVQECAERDRPTARPCQGSDGPAARNVPRNDHET
jgi:hypothetical protein